MFTFPFMWITADKNESKNEISGESQKAAE